MLDGRNRDGRSVTGTCITCDGKIHWIACPTGGWWAHKEHPADNHDAEPAPNWNDEES